MISAAPFPDPCAARRAVSGRTRPAACTDPPPISRSPATGRKPRPSGRPSAGNRSVPNRTAPPKTTEFQRFRTGVTDYGYRWYDAPNARWPSRDPIEEQGGINLYGFLNNDSINFIDMLGLRHEIIRSGTKNYDNNFSVDLMDTLGIAADFKLKGAIFWKYVCCNGETSDSNMRGKNAYIVSTNKNGLALSAQGKFNLSIKDKIKDNLKKGKNGKWFSAILDLMDIQSTVTLGVEKGMVSFHYDGCNKKASKVNAGGLVSLNGEISANANLDLLKDYDVKGSSSISGKVTAGGKISGVMADSVVYVRLANPTVYVNGNWSTFVSGGKGDFYGQDGFSYDFVQSIYLGQGATQLFKFDVVNASQK
jgi:RHS repeat-associated protein